jgi:subtilisin family serine protease
MSADLGFAAVSLTRQIDWQGQAVTVYADSWIVRSSGDLGPAAFAATSGWRASPLGEGFYSLVTPGAGTADVLGWAQAVAGVASVEPDFAIAPKALSDDPSFGSLWGLNNVGQSGGVFDADIDAPEAWNTTTGSRSVVVAVIDTGVDYTHRDLAANAWQNPGEIAGDGIDNDRNGFVDDVFGYDFVNRDGDPMDDNGHGTHVAGTIGAVGDNGTGVVGVAWQVSIMGLKFLSGSGSGSTSGAIAAINYATRMRRDFGVNIVATNNSWGGGGFSTSLRDAIEAGGRAGILFVAAAGNEATDNNASPSYPASYTSDAIISVAATTRTNQLASFSNWGATSVDIGAPGSSIYSTVPGNAYATYSGTSMATPHVTGAIALLAAANPQATAPQLRSAVLSTAVPVPALAGRVATGGLLNVAAALGAIASPPSADPPNDPPPSDPPVDPPPSDPPADPPPSDPPADPPPSDIVDVGDTLRTAAVIGNASGSVRVSGIVGDTADAGRDVDLYRVSLWAGQRFVVDIDARGLSGGSSLDSYLRLFDSRGRQLVANDDFAGSFDSYVSFTARRSGTYYVGISGYGNHLYRTTLAGSGRSGSTGFYDLQLMFGADPTRRSTVISVMGTPDAADRRVTLFAAYAAHQDAAKPRAFSTVNEHRHAARFC